MSLSTDAKKSIRAFLETLDEESYQFILSELYSHFHNIKIRDDNFLRRQKNRIQNYLIDERDSYQKSASDWITNLQAGAKGRIVTIGLDQVTRDKVHETIDNWLFLELEKYQTHLAKRKQKNTSYLMNQEKKAMDRHEQALKSDEDALLSIFWKFKSHEDDIKLLHMLQVQNWQDRLDARIEGTQDEPLADGELLSPSPETDVSAKKRKVSESG